MHFYVTTISSETKLKFTLNNYIKTLYEGILTNLNSKKKAFSKSPKKPHPAILSRVGFQSLWVIPYSISP